MLAAGNTMTGIFKNWPVEDLIISVSRVKQLREISFKTVSTPVTLCAQPHTYHPAVQTCGLHPADEICHFPRTCLL